jgi:RNA polymerase sigma factor (sigma-70 family)
LSRNERDALIHQYLGRIRLIAKRMCSISSPLDWEDVAEAGILALVERSEQYDPARGVPFWGFALPRVHGAMVDFIRVEMLHVKRSGVRVLQDCDEGYGASCALLEHGHSEDLQSVDPSPEELAVEDERRRIAKKLMDGLSRKQRTVVYRKLAGEKPGEIARSLGIKTITVNVMSHQALKRMRVLV